MWRLTEYREAEKPQWSGRTPKYVSLKETYKRQWAPPGEELTILEEGTKYSCSVNSHGVVTAYPPDGSPPIPVSPGSYYVLDFWSTKNG